MCMCMCVRLHVCVRVCVTAPLISCTRDALISDTSNVLSSPTCECVCECECLCVCVCVCAWACACVPVCVPRPTLFELGHGVRRLRSLDTPVQHRQTLQPRSTKNDDRVGILCGVGVGVKVGVCVCIATSRFSGTSASSRQIPECVYVCAYVCACMCVCVCVRAPGRDRPRWP